MKTSLYLQIEPRWGRYRFNRDEVEDVRVAKVTKNRPDETLPGCVLVKVVLDVPVEQFLTQVVEVEAPQRPAIRAVS